jgi:hypothetical protein
MKTSELVGVKVCEEGTSQNWQERFKCNRRRWGWSWGRRRQKNIVPTLRRVYGFINIGV